MSDAETSRLDEIKGKLDGMSELMNAAYDQRKITFLRKPGQLIDIETSVDLMALTNEEIDAFFAKEHARGTWRIPGKRYHPFRDVVVVNKSKRSQTIADLVEQNSNEFTKIIVCTCNQDILNIEHYTPTQKTLFIIDKNNLTSKGQEITIECRKRNISVIYVRSRFSDFYNDIKTFDTISPDNHLL